MGKGPTQLAVYNAMKPIPMIPLKTGNITIYGIFLDNPENEDTFRG